MSLFKLGLPPVDTSIFEDYDNVRKQCDPEAMDLQWGSIFPNAPFEEKIPAPPKKDLDACFTIGRDAQ